MNKLINQKYLLRNKYSFTTSLTKTTNTRVKTFEDFFIMKDWITLRRPIFHCIYARANWNPMYLKNYNNLGQNKVIKI